MKAASFFLPPREFVRSAEARERSYSLKESLAYTRWLARSHYENFHVASLLLPARLHQDFYNVYAYCRWADDLGDEIGDPAESLQLLAWWGAELEAMYRGQARHPVFLALRTTVERHGLPREPFEDLLRAFRQDQMVSRYQDWEELLAYCRYSANPVGRLVLALFGYRDPERARLSDATCTALQLANFWQDVSVDLEKGRLYLPLELLARHGCRLEDIQARRTTPAFRAAMKEAVESARRLFMEGLPLARMVNRRLAVDVELFSRGGLLVLEKIERMDYEVLAARPVITRSDRLRLLCSTAARAALGRTGQ